MFRQQAASVKKKLFIIGIILLLVQTIVIYLTSNAIVVPIERFVNKWLKNKNLSEISKQLAVSDEPYTKDLIKMSEAIANMISKQAIDAAVGRLSYQIAHDMRGPLGTILNYIQVDGEDLEVEDKAMFKESAERCTRRLNMMAEELLDYSKANLLDKRSTDLAKMLRDALAEVKSAAANGKIEFNYNGPVTVMAQVDENKINRTFINMITNASQAIKESGNVDGNITQNDEWIIIRIRDTGKGISKEHIPQIFDSTFTHGKKKGTGLGLAYCDNVIRAHDGKIEVESVEGEGSEFSIILPT